MVMSVDTGGLITSAVNVAVVGGLALGTLGFMQHAYDSALDYNRPRKRRAHSIHEVDLMDPYGHGGIYGKTKRKGKHRGDIYGFGMGEMKY